MIWTTRQRSEGPGDLAYWSEGAGPPMVLVHGVGLRAEAWAAMMPFLTTHFTVYAVDMPGHGGSPLKRIASLRDYTNRLADFTLALREPVAVAGHSMGALIALDLATRCPANLTSVGALNPVFERTPEAAMAVRTRAALLAEKGPSDPAPTLERWFGVDPQGANATAAEACRNWLTSADPTGYARAYSVFASENGPGRAALAAMQIPTLFLTGADDPNSTPDMAHAMAQHAPLGRALVVDDAAHMVPMTHPAQVAAALITHAAKETT